MTDDEKVQYETDGSQALAIETLFEVVKTF